MEILYFYTNDGITAIVEEITEEVSPRVLSNALLVVGPGITEREFFTHKEVEKFLNKIPFAKVNDRGIFFIYLSPEGTLCLRSAKESDTEAMCPLFDIKFFKKRDIIVTKKVMSRVGNV